MFGSGPEAILEVHKWSEGPPGCPGVVWRPSRISESGRETLSDVQKWWETLPNFWEWSGGHPGCPGVVVRPSRMSGSCRDALPAGRDL